MRTLLVVFALLATASRAIAVPLNGTFTIGGAAPSFATLQDAADALAANGVSGPVQLRIRPGTYLRDGGTSRVMTLNGPVAGLSPTNHVTFLPDAAAGGNVNNVILAVDQTTQTGLSVVKIGVDEVTFREITFIDLDVDQAGARFLLELEGVPITNPTIEGIVVENCRFVGNAANTNTGGLGTDYGVHCQGELRTAQIRGNSFQRLMRPISIADGAGVAGTILVENNLIQTPHEGVSGTGNPLGQGILVTAEFPTITRNTLDYAGGSGTTGILVRVNNAGTVDGNLIKNGGPTVDGTSRFTAIDADDMFPPCNSLTISNNMVMGMRSNAQMGILTGARKSLVAHNSVAIGPVIGEAKALYVEGDESRVVDNILVVRGFTSNPFAVVTYEISYQALTTSFQSDFNVLEKADNSTLVRWNTNFYSALSAYQAASGQDAATIVKLPIFVDIGQDLHLTDCSAQDPELTGTPVAAVTNDFDNQPRHPTRPVRGADEVLSRVTRDFEAQFRLGLPGTPFGMAAGKFDNLLADGLAITDYDNNVVRLYHNNPSLRSFTPAGTLPVSFQPYACRFMDLDEDGRLDLIVAGEAAAVTVFWGDGAGGFPSSATVQTLGRVVSLEPEPSPYFANKRVCWLSEDNGFLPNSGFLGLLVHLGGRQICSDVIKNSQGAPVELPLALKDLVVANLAGSSAYEIAGIGLASGSGQRALFSDFQDFFVVNPGGSLPCPNSNFEAVHVEGPSAANSYVGHGSSLAAGDFDGDGDRDIVSTSVSETRAVLMRNGGSANFSEELIPVNNAHGVVSLDYENDGDLDFATLNRQLDDNGVTLFLNDGTGHFTPRFNCSHTFGSGLPSAAVVADFDLDGKADVAVASLYDSLFVLYGNAGQTTGVADGPRRHDSGVFLAQSAPNPARGASTIRYTLPQRQHVRIAVFDLAGRRVATLVDQEVEAGPHEVVFAGAGLSSGAYLYRMETSSYVGTKKLMLVR